MRKYFLISDIETVKRQELAEFKVWFLGDSSKLLNFYTQQNLGGFQKEIIYNRNRMQYYWGLNPREENIKRVHSGLARAMCDTLSNAVGEVHIKSGVPELQSRIDKIIEANGLNALMQQQARPQVLAMGWGAFKLSIDTKLSKQPIIEFYEADKVKFFSKKGIITAVEFKDDYEKNGVEYILIERREVIEGNSVISYKLYEKNSYDTRKCSEVGLDTLEETANLQTQVVNNLDKVMAVPVKYFYDLDNKIYGRSILQGKIDLLDDLDQSLSQRSRTSRLSTPIEYIDDWALERDPNGKPILPSRYDRSFVATKSLPNGDGIGQSQIKATQPQLNFEQYTNEQLALVNMIITGVVSLSTLGYHLSKKDNADAQREKEKTTLMTRNTIIASEHKIVHQVIELSLVLQDIIDKGVYSGEKYDFSIKYDEFANPSFETKAAVYVQLWGHNAISSEMFVNLLYGESISEEDKRKEIKELEALRKEDYDDFNDENNLPVDRLERKLYSGNTVSENNQPKYKTFTQENQNDTL